MSTVVPCTVAILTKNSATTLARALDSVRDFRDILVCDGGSDDQTLEIAGRYGARIIEQDRRFIDEHGRIQDFGAIRNQTLEAAKEAWYFFLDSDEYISAELVATIRRITSSEREGAYAVHRKYVAGETVVDCSTTYPNLSTRLFARTSARSFIKKVHERIDLKDGVTAIVIPGDLYVPLDNDIRYWRGKRDRYIQLEVDRMRELGPRGFFPRFWHMLWWHSAVSVLYVLRYIRILLFCRGKKMPFSHELERHIYHIRLLTAVWRNRPHSSL